MRPLPTLLCLVLAVMLSGCAGGAAKSSGQPPMPAATATAATGGLDGHVVTDEIQPIAGAQVALLPGNVSVKTGDDGRFAFSRLDPGKYTVAALKIGYHQSAKVVQVKAGEITPLEIILDRIPIADPPFDVVHRFEGNLTVGDASFCEEDEDLLKGITWNEYPIVVPDAKEDGTPLAAVQTVIDLRSTNASGTIDIDMYLYDSKGKEIAAGTSSAPHETIDYGRLLPADNYRLFVCFWLGAVANYKITITITYEQGERAIYEREGKGK